jgi:hypothetical protein
VQFLAQPARFVADYWRTIRGPLWLNVARVVLFGVPVALAFIRSGDFWMWLSIALAVVVAIQTVAAYSEWRRTQDATPRLSLVGQGVKEHTVFQDPGRPFSVAWVSVANQTHSNLPEAEAKNVRAEVAYLDADGSVLHKGGGRWAQTDQPSTRPLGYSIDDLEETTFRADNVPQILEVAFKYDNEAVAYPFGNDNYERWRARGDPSFAIPGLELPRTTRVKVGLKGPGVVMEDRQFFLHVTDVGLEIEPC